MDRPSLRLGSFAVPKLLPVFTVHWYSQYHWLTFSWLVPVISSPKWYHQSFSNRYCLKQLVKDWFFKCNTTTYQLQNRSKMIFKTFLFQFLTKKLTPRFLEVNIFTAVNNCGSSGSRNTVGYTVSVYQSKSTHVLLTSVTHELKSVHS